MEPKESSKLYNDAFAIAECHGSKLTDQEITIFNRVKDCLNKNILSQIENFKHYRKLRFNDVLDEISTRRSYDRGFLIISDEPSCAKGIVAYIWYIHSYKTKMERKANDLKIANYVGYSEEEIKKDLFPDDKGGLIESLWEHGTLFLQDIESKYPKLILRIAARLQRLWSTYKAENIDGGNITLTSKYPGILIFNLEKACNISEDVKGQFEVITLKPSAHANKLENNNNPITIDYNFVFADDTFTVTINDNKHEIPTGKYSCSPQDIYYCIQFLYKHKNTYQKLGDVLNGLGKDDPTKAIKAISESRKILNGYGITIKNIKDTGEDNHGYKLIFPK